MQLKEKKIAVLGVNEEGLEWMLALAKAGALVTGFGRRSSEESEKIQKKFQGVACQFYWDKIGKEDLLTYDLVIDTPGAGTYREAVEQAKKKGVAVMSDLDLATQFITVPIIAVTGTNGKSTTVTLLRDMLLKQGYKVLVLGGDFSPWASVLAEKTKYDYCLMELSSRRLEVSQNFHPHIALFLNLFPAHGERHEAGYLGYVKAKAKIFFFQTEQDYLIHESSAQNVNELIQRLKTRSRRVRFSLQGPVEPPGIFLDKTRLVWSGPDSELEVYPLEKASIRTLTHVLNLMAAIAAARLLKVEAKHIQSVIETFKGLPHRLQLVRAVGGVLFVDDSRSTNVAAAVWALHSLPINLLWIAGGAPIPGANWEEAVQSGQGRVREIFLYGSAGQKLASTLQALAPVTLVKNLEEAVQLAHKKSGHKDVVLFSPGCPPDLLAGDFQENRGERFFAAVKKLKEPPSILQKTSVRQRPP